MTDNDLSRGPSKRFVRFIALAAAVAAIVTCLTQLHLRNQKQKQIASLINESGRQRMLTQRMALIASREGVDADTKRDRIAPLLERFESNLELLQEASPKLASSNEAAADLRGFFGDGPHRLQAKALSYAASLRGLMADPELGASSVSVDRVVEIAAGDDLLNTLDAFVAALQRDAERQSEESAWLLTALMLLVGVSVGGLLFAFAPESPSVRRAKAESRKLDELLRNVTRTARDHAIVTLDLEGKITSWNEGAERLMGYERDEVIGQHVELFYPKDRESQDRARGALREAFDSGDAEIEDWRVKKNGKRFWANVVVTQLRDERGEPIGFSKITRDLTERRRNEQRFRKSLESAPLAMLMIDRSREIVMANEETVSLFGYSEKELLGTLVDKLLPSSHSGLSPSRIEALFEKAETRKLGTGRSVKGVGKGGHEFSIEIGLSRVQSEGETLLLLTIVDTTEIEAARKKVEESERRFRELADSAPLSMWVTDEDKSCVWLNRRWLDYAGMTLEESLGVGWLKTVHPDDREEAFATYQAAFEKAQPFSLSYRLRRSDGSHRWHTAFGQPRIDADGYLRGYVGLSVDDHDERANRKALENAHEALKESANIHRSLIDQSNNFIGLMTPDGVLTDANRTSLEGAGIDADEVLGKPFVETPWWRHSEALRQRLLEAIDRAAGGETDRFEATHLDEFGEPIYIDFSLTPVKSESGEVIYLIPEGRDVTLHRRREAELQETLELLDHSNRDLEQFAYIASHDLQEPLRKISSYCQLLSEEQGERLDDEGREYLQVVVEGADRLKKLVKDLLSFSRITTRGKELAPTSSEDCLREALGNLEVAIEESRARIGHDPLPPVIADASQLVSLFQNLVGNAIKYRGDDAPRIHVGGRELGSEFEFFVRDNGIGIAEEHSERVFKIFQRLHNRRDYSGTGIGLALCKRIIERSGGRVWLESEPGEGSTFYFTMPLADEKGSLEPSPGLVEQSTTD